MIHAALRLSDRFLELGRALLASAVSIIWRRATAAPVTKSAMPHLPSLPRTPTSATNDTSLARNLTGTLARLGKSLLVLRGGDGTADESDASGQTAVAGAAEAIPVNTPGVAAGDSHSRVEPGGTVPGQQDEDETVTKRATKDEEAISVLRRALGMLRSESAAAEAVASHPHEGIGDISIGTNERITADAGQGVGDEAVLADGKGSAGQDRSGNLGEGGVRRQTATVLDSLSEAYARKRRWEQAR